MDNAPFRETGIRECGIYNCDDESRAKDMFMPDYDMDRILLSIQVISQKSVCPRAVVSVASFIYP